MSDFIRKITIFLSLFLVFSYPEIIADEENVQFISYPINESDITYIDEIKNGVFSLDKEDDFSLKTQIVTKTNKINWYLQKKTIIHANESMRCKDSPVTHEWILNSDREPFDIWDYNRLFFKWELAHSFCVPNLNVSIELDTDDDGKSDLNLHAIYPTLEKELTLLNEYQVDQEEFVAKSNMYLIRRELGLKEDSKWRYVQRLDQELNENQVVFQKRTDLPLAGVDAIKITMLPTAEFRMVVFSLDTTGNGRRDRFLLYHEMTHNREKLGGYDVETIDVKDTFSRLGLSQSSTVLLEPIFYVGGQITSFLQNKPIKTLSTYTYKQKTDITANQVELIVHKNGLETSLTIDLEKELDKRDIWDGKILRATAEASLDSPQIITWKEAFLGAYEEIDTPILFSEPLTLLKQYIPTFSLAKPNQLITQFNPLLWKKLTLNSRPDYLTQSYEDRDIHIEVENTYYQVDKDFNQITIHGITLANATPTIRIKLKEKDTLQNFNLSSERLRWGTETIYQTDQQREIRIPSWSTGHTIQIQKNKDLDLIFQAEIENATFSLRDDSFSKSWKISLTKEDSVLFEDAIPSSDNGSTWKSTFKIQGVPYLFVTGLNQGEDSLPLTIVYIDENQDSRRIFLPIRQEKNPIPIHISPQSIVQDILLEGSNRLGVRTLEFFIVDIVSEEYSENMKYEKFSWWEKDAIVALKPVSNSVVCDKKRNKWFLWNSEGSAASWRFKPERNYIKPVSITLNPPPFTELKYFIDFGDTRIEFPKGASVFEFEKYLRFGDDFSLVVTYTGDKQLLAIDPPELVAFGVQKNARQTLEQTNILLDGKPVLFSSIQFPSDNVDWQTVGTIRLATGSHFLEMKDNSFFSLDSVLLEAKGQYPLPTFDENNIPQGPSIINRLIRMGIKLGILVVFLMVLYIFRLQIKNILAWFLSPIYNTIQSVYWFTPEEGLFILWALLGSGLYAVGLQMNPTGMQENYFFTFGGIALVFTYWHFSRLIKNWFNGKFPKIAFYVYRGKGTPFISGFIVLLIWIAILVSLKLEPIAEQIAVIGYYFLVVGVIAEFVEMRKNDREET